MPLLPQHAGVQPFQAHLEDLPAGTDDRTPCEASWNGFEREGMSAVSALPRHLWCWVAQYNGVAETVAMLQCSSWLQVSFEVEALWHYLSLVSDFARPVTGPGGSWLYPFHPKLAVHRLINWRKLSQLNLHRRGSSAVWVRVVDVDLRLALPPGGISGSALQAEVETLVCRMQGASLRAPERLNQEHQVWPLRLRWLQWGGRPGLLVQESAIVAGAKLLLEWALPPSYIEWPLPPQMRGPQAPVSSELSSGAVACAGHQAFPDSWSLSPSSSTGTSAVNSILGAGVAAAMDKSFESVERTLLLRIVSLLVPREIWLTVDIDATVGSLYEDIAKVLRCHSFFLANICSPIQLQLMRSRSSDETAVRDEQPLREIFWAQSETVYVEMMPVRAKSIGVAPVVRTPGSPLMMVVWRERAFGEASAQAEGGSNSRDILGNQSGAGFSRLLSEPVPQPVERMRGVGQGWARQISDPLATFGQDSSWPRQVSEPASMKVCPTDLSSPEAAPGCWGVEGFSHEGATVSVSSRPASGGSFPWLSGGAEEQAREIEEDDNRGVSSALGQGVYAGSSALPRGFGDKDSLAFEGTTLEGTSWERIVPHYKPKLLPTTLGTRQFEFHPSLPDLILMGDKRGSLNIFDIEAQEVHPPLVVDSSPMLGLVCLRHHPQTAICGASHSGNISFLKYDPEAALSAPALQRIHTIEEFPKLSSLSANCTDDFLLASGISPNIAVYDVRTGKVLLGAQGVHEHVVNISRFCNSSPHIFATASFDHTCKVWDLRQKILPNRSVKTLNTGFHNVMCIFSPDDKHVLCSGVDTRIMQFEVPSWRQTPEQFQLREPMHRERYRRSTYLATGQHFVTAATEESHMHILGVNGKKFGVVDFRGVVQEWVDRGATQSASRQKTSEAESCCLQAPPSYFDVASMGQGRAMHLPFQSHSSGSAASFVRSDHTARQQDSGNRLADASFSAEPVDTGQLVCGRVRLDDADSNGGSSRNNHEFVQSIRTHQTVTNRIGVLLSMKQTEQSYVVLVDMHRRFLERPRTE